MDRVSNTPHIAFAYCLRRKTRTSKRVRHCVERIESKAEQKEWARSESCAGPMRVHECMRTCMCVCVNETTNGVTMSILRSNTLTLVFNTHTRSVRCSANGALTNRTYEQWRRRCWCCCWWSCWCTLVLVCALSLVYIRLCRSHCGNCCAVHTIGSFVFYLLRKIDAYLNFYLMF